MKILSLLLLSTALFCDVHAAEDHMPPQKGKSALIQSVIEAPSFAENRLPASFKARFDRDSAKVKNAISTFFKDSDELQDRLTDFDNVYQHGASLFKEREDHTAHSRNVALVYLSYAALMSKETGDMDYSPNNPQGFRVEYKNPQTILAQIDNSSSSSANRLLKSNLLCLPLLSKTGHLTLEHINESYSHSLAVMGVPYGSLDQNTFDAETDASPLNFALHDSIHAGQYLFPTNPLLFSDGKSRNYGPLRRAIYNTMQSEGLTHTFAVPYFMTFHENGLTPTFNGGFQHLDPNPIQNAINFLNDFYTPADNQDDHILNSILKNTRGFQALTSEKVDEFGGVHTTFGRDYRIPNGRDDIVLSVEDVKKQDDNFKYYIHFTLKSQPGENFALNSVSYTQMMETGVDLAKLLNSYGAHLDIPDDLSQFNVNAFMDTMLQELNAFNATYGHLFETA